MISFVAAIVFMYRCLIGLLQPLFTLLCRFSSIKSIFMSIDVCECDVLLFVFFFVFSSMCYYVNILYVLAFCVIHCVFDCETAESASKSTSMISRSLKVLLNIIFNTKIGSRMPKHCIIKNCVERNGSAKKGKSLVLSIQCM